MKELTKAEEQIMQVLWRLGRGLVKDVLDELPEPKPAYNTVSTIVRILERKGFVSYKAYGKTHEYFPVVDDERVPEGVPQEPGSSVLREFLPGARVLLRQGPPPDARGPRGDSDVARGGDREEERTDAMTGLPWYLAETGAALAVFYGRVSAGPEERHPFSDGPALPAGVPRDRAPAAALPRDLAVPAGGRSGGSPRGPRHDRRRPPRDGPRSRRCSGLYAAGAAVVFLRLAWHLAHLVLIARQHPVVHRDGVRVVYVDEDCPPFSFFRTAFVHRPAAGDEQVLDQVVAHERTHIRQGHSLDILLIHRRGRRAVVQSVRLALQARSQGASRIPRRPGSPCARLRPVHL